MNIIIYRLFIVSANEVQSPSRTLKFKCKTFSYFVLLLLLLLLVEYKLKRIHKLIKRKIVFYNNNASQPYRASV